MIALDVDSRRRDRGAVDLALVSRRPSARERAHDDANAWIKALRHLARRRRADPRALHVPRRLAVVVRRALPPQGAGDPARAPDHRGVRRAGRARRPLAVRVRLGTASRRRRRRRPRRASVRYSGPGFAAIDRLDLARMDRARERARRRRAAVAAARAARGRAAPRARRGVRPHRVLAVATAPTAAPSRTSARCCARSRARVAAADIRYVGDRRRARTSARGAGGIRSSPRGDAAIVADRALAPARRAGGVARRSAAIGTARGAACGTATRSARARRDPRLRLLAARAASSSRASRCCSCRGRRARWTKPARRSTRCSRRSPSPTPRPAAGAARSCSKPAARHAARRACSTASSTATGSTTATSPTRSSPDPGNPPIAASRFRRARCCSTSYAARHLHDGRPLSRRRAGGHRQRAAGRAGRASVARAGRRTTARVRRERRRRADAGAGRCFAAKEREARPCPAGARRRRRARMPGVQLVIKPHPAETPEVYAAAVAGVRQRPRARRRRAARRAARRGRRASSPSTRPWRSTRWRSAAVARHRPAQQPDAVRRRRA